MIETMCDLEKYDIEIKDGEYVIITDFDYVVETFPDAESCLRWIIDNDVQLIGCE